jgi:hypothetical protein
MASPAAGELTAGQNTLPVSPVPVTAVIAPAVTPALATELTWMLNPDQPSVTLGAVVLTSTVGAVAVPATVPNEIVPPTPSAEAGSNKTSASDSPVAQARNNAKIRFTNNLQVVNTCRVCCRGSL